MTYKEESYVLNNIKQIAKEIHENNIMFKRIIKVINTWIRHHPVPEDGEQAAYLIGYIVQRMHRVFTNMISTEVK